MANNVNININVDSFQKFFEELGERIKHLSAGDVAMVILALIMPPVAVLLRTGMSTHFWINVLLTVMGFVPGQIHALWVVLFL